MFYSNILFCFLFVNNSVLISKTTEKRIASADVNRQKSETKDYLPDWLEPKKAPEDKSSDYVQDRVTPTEELFSKHRRSSSDKIIQEVSNNIDMIMKMILNFKLFITGGKCITRG